MSIFLVLILLLGSITSIFYDKDFYYNQYKKQDVYQTLIDNRYSTSIDESKEFSSNVTLNIINFFSGKEELRYFTDLEKSHMQDVKNILEFITYIYYVSVLIIILLLVYMYKRFRRNLNNFVKIISRSMIYSALFVIAFYIITFILAFTSFDVVFSSFHEIFFPMGNWMFDSSSLLITLFSERFFFNTVLQIATYSFFQCVIFVFLGYWFNKQISRINKK